ncbi:leucyl aminopeptidase family protein [Roseomonas sp. M0104]|uniref:Leucyl aminopeptidase family protein n=1 Tax=Teichococcus coralli TaxID=2545983 RepID=A0A845BHA8_9PROT|nr:leucyl aminopeptidase family protein [Pseudoroseomonas coralli]MXP65516.1 leucyl aminopeptidase family protein [Pseudoroseomonas coralli]
MRLRLRTHLGPKAAARPRLLPWRADHPPPLPDMPFTPGTARWREGVAIAPGPEWRQAGAAAVAVLPEGTRHAVLDARALRPEEAVAMAMGALLQAPRGFRLDLWHRGEDALAPLCRDARAVLKGVLLARRLTAAPGNALTPKIFARRLRRLERHGIGVQVLGRRRLRAAGFGALLAVGEGSANPPRLVVLRWRGRIAAPPLVLVGKGITFDTGGLCLKPAAGMEAMRADMAGAAACAGAMLALALRDSPAPVAAVLPLAENALGAAAYRPGDIITTLSGLTVEVVDTDAEGRLVLADALTYAVRAFRPEAVVDLATLTGAVVTALGHHRAGLFGNDAPLAAALCAAGEAVGERLWPLPIGAAHRRDLESGIADLRQCASGRLQPDACHAAAFLSAFLGGSPPAWAHLDIAGMAEEPADRPPGAAPAPGGFGVRLLDALVASRFEDPHRR